MKTFNNLIYNETMKIVENIDRQLSEKIFPSFDPVIVTIELYEKTYKHQLRIIEAELKRYRWKFEARPILAIELNYRCDNGVYKIDQKQAYKKKKDVVGVELKISIDQEEFRHIFE